MLNATAAESQIPLFKDLSQKVHSPELRACQLTLVDAGPVQLSFSLMLPPEIIDGGIITSANYERHMLLIKAAALTPGKTKREVLRQFAHYSQGDNRQEVLEHFLKTYIKKGQIKMALASGPRRPVHDEHAPLLSRWSVFHSH